MSSKPLRLAFLLLPLLGCSSAEPAVSGTVTVNGQPLASGYITFFPAVGTATTVGAEISAGRYEIKGLPPGDRRVVVAVSPRMQAALRPNGALMLEMPLNDNPVSLKTQGNNQFVEILAGQQVYDVALSNSPVIRR